MAYSLFYFSFVLDCVDGQICRVADKASVFGKFFDGWVDTIYDLAFSIIIALSISDYGDGIMSFAILASLMNAFLWVILLRYTMYEKVKNINLASLKRKFSTF